MTQQGLERIAAAIRETEMVQCPKCGVVFDAPNTPTSYAECECGMRWCYDCHPEYTLWAINEAAK